MNSMKELRAVCYHRVSTQEQAESGLGMDAQKRDTEAVCAYKSWSIAAIAEDAGRSGKTADRPGLIAAMELLDRGEADVLVAAKLDRLSRSTLDFSSIMHRAAQHNWNVCIKDLDLDTSTANGRLVLNIMSALAEWEREMISQRTKDGLETKKRQGIKLGRPGVDPKVRQRILDYREGGCTYQQIADKLNADGVPTPQGGRKWYDSSVRSTITTRARTK